MNKLILNGLCILLALLGTISCSIKSSNKPKHLYATVSAADDIYASRHISSWAAFAISAVSPATELLSECEDPQLESNVTFAGTEGHPKLMYQIVCLSCKNGASYKASGTITGPVGKAARCILAHAVNKEVYCAEMGTSGEAEFILSESDCEIPIMPRSDLN